MKKLFFLFILFSISGRIIFPQEELLFRRVKINSKENFLSSQGYVPLGKLGVILNSDFKEMSRTTVEILIERMKQIIQEKGEVKLGLPTGNTPQLIYELLRTEYKNDPLWEKVILVQLDEYVGVDPFSPDSFQYQLRENLVNHVKLKRFISINGNAQDRGKERERYENEIKSLGELDLLVLGVGRNGHLAFHEPGFVTDKLVDIVPLTEQTKRDNGVSFSQAFTLTLNTILKAKEIILIASGEKKKEILNKALLGEVSLDVPASFLQNHNRTRFLITQDATDEDLFVVFKAKLKDAIIKQLEKSAIKILASDLDFTLSPLGEHLRKSVLEKLKQLAEKGGHIAVITGASYRRIKEQILDYLPQDFPWQYLHIYSNIGAGGYGFDASGKRITYYEIKLFPEQWEKLREVVKEFQEEYKEDFEDFWETEGMKGTIVLKDRLRVRETYEKYLTFLERRLKNTGLVINGTGYLGTIDITRADKSYAMFNLRDRLNILSEEMVYVGDTFSGKFANDLPTMIPGSWIFNVGSIERIPPGVFSLGIRGDLGTEVLLEVLLEKR